MEPINDEYSPVESAGVFGTPYFPSAGIASIMAGICKPGFC
jgi:hypothetical protein